MMSLKYPKTFCRPSVVYVTFHQPPVFPRKTIHSLQLTRVVLQAVCSVLFLSGCLHIHVTCTSTLAYMCDYSIH